MQEWLNWLVSKTSEPLPAPRVRIPLSPPEIIFMQLGVSMKDSIFTKIVAGEIPAHKVYEDDATLAFLDIFPQHEGHVLIIPKIYPTEFIWDLDPETYLAVMETAQKVALRLREVLPYQYVCQKIVGTDVPYAHVHLVPFDATSELHADRSDTDHDALADLAKKLYFED